MTLIESIYSEPGQWRLDKFWLHHKGGARLWIANGPFFCNPSDIAGAYSFRQKIAAWRAFRWWVANAPVEALS